MSAESIVRSLSEVRLPNVFNPYADICDVHDRPNAAAARRANLRSFLITARALKIDTLWMGRDLGYRGGRRTGLALTDEAHLSMFSTLYNGSAVKRATKGPPVAERTAAEIWSAIVALTCPPFLWNVFPFHPYEPGNPFSNRRFTTKELDAVRNINQALIDWLGIVRIVAIGQDAAHYSASFGVEVMAVRHPSYGGITDFRLGIKALYPKMQRASAQASLF